MQPQKRAAPAPGQGTGAEKQLGSKQTLGPAPGEVKPFVVLVHPDFASDVASRTGQEVTTWPRDSDPMARDWTGLAGRPVAVLAVGLGNSAAEHLAAKLRAAGALADIVRLDEISAPAAGKVEAGACKLVVVNVHDLLALDLPERGHVLHPVIPEQGLGMLYAPRGLGKTWAGLSIAYAVASEQKVFGRWEAPRPRRVLYLDGEMPAAAMRDRLASIVAGYEGEPPDPDYMRLLTPDLQQDGMPNMATPAGQAAVAPLLEGVELVVVDNIATLGRHGRENEAESWTPLQTWILALRRQGKSVLLIHHAGKGGNQRGTSAREDVLDTVIALRRPEDYQAEEGARFEVHLEKARGMCGPECRPFEATLRLDHGAARWSTRELEDVELERVRQLKAEGMSVRDISNETGMSRSKVHRTVKKLEGRA